MAMNTSANGSSMPDHDEYYACGLAMNHAWQEAAEDICGEAAWQAAQAMKAAAPVCAKLRQGEGYVRSYEALLLDSDTWCGFPGCKPSCAEGVPCERLRVFPF